MRRFFVCFLLLGVFTLNTQLLSAGMVNTLVGSWEVVSIDGKPVMEHLRETVSIDDKPFMEYLWERTRVDFDLFDGKSVAELLERDLSKVTQNNFVFFNDGSWRWRLRLDMEADIGGGLTLIPAMSLANHGFYNGLDDVTINIIRGELDILLEPEDFWVSVEGLEEDMREAITRDWLFGKVENWEERFSDDENTLTLTRPDGIKLVLKRKEPPKPDLDRTPKAKNTWVSVPEGDPLESILKDPRQELQLKMSKNANSHLSRAWDRVTDGSKRLEELRRLKAEAEAELKHVERLQRLKVEIIEELTRLEELQRLKMKMPEKLAVSGTLFPDERQIYELLTEALATAEKERFDGIYKREGFVRTGTDYALLFATDAYTHRNNLISPIADAEAIGAELANRYGFKVDLRKNVQRTEILNTLVEYAEKSYQPGDQLFIYFAGTGNFSEALNDGYIAASDSKLPEEDPSHATYLSYARLRQDLDSIACERVMLVLDVCYGGTFDDNSNALIEEPVTRGARAVMKPILDLNQTLKVKTRWYLSSGGKEVVYDGVGGHSPFALSLLTVLRDGAGRDGVLTIPEIERQLPIKLREELDKIEIKYPLLDGKIQQTPASGPFGSGKAADKAFVFIEKDFVVPSR